MVNDRPISHGDKDSFGYKKYRNELYVATGEQMNVIDLRLQAIFLPIFMMISVVYISRRFISTEGQHLEAYRHSASSKITGTLNHLNYMDDNGLRCCVFIMIGVYMSLTYLLMKLIPSLCLGSSIWKFAYVSGILYAIFISFLVTLSNDLVTDVMIRISKISNRILLVVVPHKFDIFTQLRQEEDAIFQIFIKHFILTCFIFRNVGTSIQTAIFLQFGACLVNLLNNRIIIESASAPILIWVSAATIGIFMGAIAREYLCLTFHEWRHIAWFNIKVNPNQYQGAKVDYCRRVLLIFIVSVFYAVVETNAGLFMNALNLPLQDMKAFVSGRYILLTLLFAIAAVEVFSLFNNQTHVLGPSSCLIVLIFSLELSMTSKLLYS